MLVYYAHCKSIYNTAQEARDLELLNKLGFNVLNPNQEIHQEKCMEYKNCMDYFLELVDGCDAVVFRALPDNKIPAGVYKELQHAYKQNKPVFELPVNIILREMSLDQTRAYLTEIGQR